jgi:RNA recognition motif-containing protein
MSKTVFVGNLSYSTSTEGLCNAFQGFGEILEGKVVTDRATGRSRGFGFVTFKESESADRAIREMDGKELDGRPIRVREAIERQREDSPREPRRRHSRRF